MAEDKELQPVAVPTLQLAPPWGGNGWSLHNPLTLERYPLPEPVGVWEIIEEDGFFAVADSGSSAFHMCEDLLTRKILKDDAGTLFLEYPMKSGKVRRDPLFQKQAEHRPCEIMLNLGPTNAQHTIKLAFLKLPRPGGSAFLWACKDLYSVLAMTTYRQTPSKWIFAALPHGIRHMEAYGLPGQFVKSTQGIEAISDSAAKLHANNFLGFVGLSTYALIQELARWSVCDPNEGGLRGKRVREAASLLLHGLLENTFQGQPTSICLTFKAAYRHPWPAPITSSDVKLQIKDSEA